MHFNVLSIPTLWHYLFSDGQTVITFPPGWLEKMKEENSKHRPIAPYPQTLDDLAYTVYSSGTTGKPKGQSVQAHRTDSFSSPAYIQCMVN